MCRCRERREILVKVAKREYPLRVAAGKVVQTVRQDIRDLTSDQKYRYGSRKRPGVLNQPSG
jgi:hypothetical protein